jgi:hypothetical protein
MSNVNNERFAENKMKKLLVSTATLLYLASISATAQNLLLPTGNVGIGTSTPNAYLHMVTTYSDLGSSYSTDPGLKLQRVRIPNITASLGGGPGGGGPTNNPPNILEILTTDPYTVPPTTNAPNFIINNSGNFGFNAQPISTYKFHFGGNTQLAGNTQVTAKFRVNSTASLVNADWNTANFPYSFSVDNGNSRFLGKVQIGSLRPTTTYTNYALAVDGDIVCKKQVVQIGDWADYVFAPNYSLMTLNEVAKFVTAKKHLPGMPSQEEIVQNGLDLGAMQKLQQQKIEELTLYIIQQQKQIEQLQRLITK